MKHTLVIGNIKILVKALLQVLYGKHSTRGEVAQGIDECYIQHETKHREIIFRTT